MTRSNKISLSPKHLAELADMNARRKTPLPKLKPLTACIAIALRNPPWGNRK